MKEQMNTAKAKMEKCLKSLEHEFTTIRAGRANPAVLDKVFVDYYGAPTPVNQMAAISVSEARVLVIQPWDASALKMIEKAIQTSDVGINPTNDGKVLRLVFPQHIHDLLWKFERSLRLGGLVFYLLCLLSLTLFFFFLNQCFRLSENIGCYPFKH